MAKRFWTAEEVEQEFGVTRKTLYRWRQFGLGPRAIRVGRWLRYPADEIEKWVAERAAAEKARYGNRSN